MDQEAARLQYSLLSGDDILVAYKTLFNSYEGAIVLEDLKRAFHYYDTVYSDMATFMAMQEGQRSVILRILYVLMSELETDNG